MEEIVGTALAYFDIAGYEVKKSAIELLERLDREGGATIGKFEAFLREKGLEIPRGLYKELKLDHGDPLGFTEFLVMLYAAKTRRPCCDICGAFLKGLYFTCFMCFEIVEYGAYNLCTNCLRKHKKCPHGHATFVDDSALLQSKSKAAQKHLAESTARTQGPHTMQPLHDIFDFAHKKHLQQLSSPDKHGRKLFMDTTVSGGTNVTTICSIL